MKDPKRGRLTKVWQIENRAEICGSYFFSAGATRFFKSKTANFACPTPNGAVFITAEKGPHGPRKYTVREMNGCSIRTRGRFQKFYSLYEAKRAAKNLCTRRRQTYGRARRRRR